MDICIGIMDKYARFYITVWIDVTVESSASDTSADKLTVILEVKYKDWLASFKSSDLTDSVVHIFSLLRCQKQICCCFISDRHRPGVTKGKQWVSTEKFDLLDMPGVLWKKFDSKTIASNLAFIGSIKDDILDVEELAMNLLDEVRRNYPDLVAQRYKLDAETLALPPYELMEAIGRKRGLLVRGGEVNTERCAIMLVDEFRACKWGRISLERPPQRDDLADFAEEDDE